MKALLTQLNESLCNSREVTTWPKVVADTFRRCVSVGYIKRLRDLEDLGSECTDVSCKGKLRFLATVGNDQRRYDVDYTLSETDVFTYTLNISENSVPVLEDQYEMGQVSDIDLHNKLIFRTQDSLRKLTP